LLKTRLIASDTVKCSSFLLIGWLSVTVSFVESTKLPTAWATFEMHGFWDEANQKEHVVLSLGDVGNGQPVLARVHSECLTGDALFSQRCDCGPQLSAALEAIAKEGRGVLLYLRQEGRGIGLLNKIKAYRLQDLGADTVEANEQLGFAADLRDYSICQPMLEHLHIQQVRLMTNNPRKVKALQSQGIDVVERLPLLVGENPHNERYLATKAGKLGHLLDHQHEL
jgi:GTP cyclohydrolase II